MGHSQSTPPPHAIHLAAGAQAVINGALVTAIQPCSLEIGSGAFVLTGRSLWRSRDSMRNPHEELYFSMLEAGTNEDRFYDARFRLFRLLGQVVAQDRTHQAQRECTLCASALIAGNIKEAVSSAARLASARLDRSGSVAANERQVPGRRARHRSNHQRSEYALNPSIR